MPKSWLTTFGTIFSRITPHWNKLHRKAIKSRLDDLYNTFDDGYLSSDPISMVREYDKPEDQEIVAVLASALAFGQVGQILKAGRAALRLMGDSPYQFVMAFQPEQEIERWSGFYYRMVRSTDLLRVLHALQHLLRRYDTLGEWVTSNYLGSDAHLGESWGRCIDNIKEIDSTAWCWNKSTGRGFAHLLPDPRKQSASKRVHLLLRWMVRRDSVDLGLWSGLPADKLLMPIDTHVGRLAYNIGLTNRTDLSRKTAEEVTGNLKRLDSKDPVKYDFALSRLGILSYCPRKKQLQKCKACSIVSICRL